jgi:hypothetical protein
MSDSQAVRDIAASHETLINLFERIHFFLQRLHNYIGIALTNEFTELLGKTMAQILSILTLSTKAIKERRISELVYSLLPFETDCDSETFLKRLIGRRDIEDALLRLDSLTKEESLMALARNLEVTHRIDTVIRDVDDNVKTTKDGAQRLPSVLTHVLTLFFSNAL